MASQTLNRVLIVDAEGVGWPIEIGAIYWDLNADTWEELLIEIPPRWREEFVSEKQHIYAQDEDYRATRGRIVELRAWGLECDAILAHNATHTRDLVCGILELRALFTKKWICTMRDFPWKHGLSAQESLRTICNTMEVPYENAHHALVDCKLLAKCITKMPDFRGCLDAAEYTARYKAKMSTKVPHLSTLAERKFYRKTFQYKTQAQPDYR